MFGNDPSSSPTDRPGAPLPGWVLKLSRWSGILFGLFFAFITYVLTSLILGLFVSGNVKSWLTFLLAAAAGVAGFLFSSRFLQMGYAKLQRFLKPALLILGGLILLLLILRMFR
jgi:hypothetical protein